MLATVLFPVHVVDFLPSVSLALVDVFRSVTVFKFGLLCLS